MTANVDPLQAWAGIAEAAGINTLAACIELVKAAGYTVTRPKTKAKSADFRNDLVSGYRAGMKEWDRVLVTWTFADGSTVNSYALRENERKAWLLGSSLRAACDKWRYRNNRRREWQYFGPMGDWSDREPKRDARGRLVFQDFEVVYVPCPGRYTGPIGPQASLVTVDAPIDLIEVPEVIACDFECDLGQANSATENYRAADKDRPRKIFERTAHL